MKQKPDNKRSDSDTTLGDWLVIAGFTGMAMYGLMVGALIVIQLLP